MEGEIFHTHPDRPWRPPSLLYSGYRVFPGGKAAGVWRWPSTPSSAEVKERVQLYLYSTSGPSWPGLGWTLPLSYIYIYIYIYICVCVCVCMYMYMCVCVCVYIYIYMGAWGGVVVKALRYKSEGPGIDPRSLGIFSGASDSSMCPGVDSASKNE